MEQHGNNTTYNVETVLRQNILSSEYYQKTCEQLTTWSDIVDEIYEHVDHVEPWMSGNARGPSSAFCLLYKLFTLKLNVKQIKDLLEHADSPYIRAVGFLYLRYVCDPKNIWAWVQKYADDREEFQPSPGQDGKMITIGDYVRDLLLEQNYFETILSRIPKKVTDEIVEDLKKRGLPYTGKGNGGQGGSDRRGTDDGNRRPASVKASLSVAMGQRAPNRSGAREEGRGKDPSMRRPVPASGRDRDPPPRGRSSSKSPPPHRDSRDRGYGGGKDSVDKDRDARDRDGGRDRGYERRDDRGRDSFRDERQRYDRDRDDRGRQRDDRGRDDRYERSTRESDRRRPRSRSRSPQRADNRDARDVFKERVAGSVADVKSVYGDASGRLDDGRSDKRDYRTTEVYKIGGSRR